MSETASKTPPYVPTTTAASERIAGSVMDRVATTSVANSDRSLQLADRVIFGYLGEQSGAQPEQKRRLPASERTLASAPPPSFTMAKTARPRSERHQVIAAPAPIAEPPAQPASAGLHMPDAKQWTGPLWGALPQAKLAPVLTALETALGTAPPPSERQQQKPAGSTAPSMPLLQNSGGRKSAGDRAPGGTDDKERSAGGPALSAAAMESSARLLDALRAHAAALATAGGDRVSLKDMATINFAEKKQQLAAGSVAEPPPQAMLPEPIPDMNNLGLFKNVKDTVKKAKEVANWLKKKMEQNQQVSDARHGTE